MLDKGKGHFIDHLRIIQLCEVDLNFILHILWGVRPICNPQQHKALNPCQYSLPGLTGQSAVWNKVLSCDLIRQQHLWEY